MSIIYILIPIAILFTALGIYLFFWAVKSDQFEDLEKQGLSILFDDEDTLKDLSKNNQENKNTDNNSSTANNDNASTKEKC